MIIHVPNGPSIKGLLVDAHRDCLVLTHGRSLDHDQELGGDVVVPLVAGVWVQTVEQAQ